MVWPAIPVFRPSDSTSGEAWKVISLRIRCHHIQTVKGTSADRDNFLQPPSLWKGTAQTWRTARCLPPKVLLWFGDRQRASRKDEMAQMLCQLQESCRNLEEFCENAPSTNSGKERSRWYAIIYLKSGNQEPVGVQWGTESVKQMIDE